MQLTIGLILGYLLGLGSAWLLIRIAAGEPNRIDNKTYNTQESRIGPIIK